MSQSAERIFANRYRLIDRLGTGGMADVFRAEDMELRRVVAIKVLHPQFSSDPVFIERFRREAQSVAKLAHPNVVSVFDWGREDGVPYLVMELLEGQTLRQLISEKGRLTPDESIEIALGVCSALQHAHDNHVVHRDIKPHNIVMTAQGVKVADFGIARLGGAGATMTQSGSIMGTAHYFSPEQARGRPTGTPSDIYSLGIVLYEMLTGEVPFAGDNPVSVALRHVNEPPPPPHLKNRRIPPDLEKVVLKTLAKDPDERYATAEDLASELRRIQKGLPVRATAPMAASTSASEAPTVIMPAPYEKERRAERRVLAWSVLAGLLIVLGAAVAFYVLESQAAAQVVVPSLSNMSESQARERLEDLGLRLLIKGQEPDETVAKGLIVRQIPEAGDRVSRDSQVQVVLSSGKPKVDTPSLIGKNKDEAILILGQAGLKLGEVSEEFSSSAEEDVIIGQDPDPGARVEEDSTVNLVVSKGEETVAVPDLVGKTFSEASAALLAVGLRVNKRSEFNDAPKEQVVAQEPGGGSKVSPDTIITLTVSSGPKETSVTIPTVTGFPKDVATKMLRDRGLVVVVQTQPTDNTDPDIVIGQEPLPGEVVTPGSTITILVAEAPPEEEQPPVTSTTTPVESQSDEELD